VEPRDRADREVARLDAELAPCVGNLVGAARAAEFLERHPEVDDFDF
jgi:hypothetical protein